MGKLTLAQERERYDKARAATNRQDFEFLDPAERRARVCQHSWEINPFLDKIFALAEKAQEREERISVILDVETDNATRRQCFVLE